MSQKTIGKWRLAAVVVVLLLSALAPTPLQAQLPERGSPAMDEGDAAAARGEYRRALQSWKRAYELRIPEMRGLEFRRPVRPGFMGRSDLQAFILEELARELPPAELDRLRKSFVALGLADTTFDPARLLPRLFTEELGGFYDPRRKQLFLIAEVEEGKKPPRRTLLGQLFGGAPRFDPEEQKMVLVHEMSHALMDQHYDLELLQMSVSDDDDAAMALTALVEGEATAMMFLPMAGREFLRTPADVMDRQMSLMLPLLPGASGPTLRQAPRAISEPLLFSYFKGLVFVLALTNHSGGWQGVDAAFRSPPLSTEHILHPEKYLAGDDPPLGLELGDLAGAAGADWSEVNDNVLGEVLVELVLRERGTVRSVLAAQGWGGDRYQVLEHRDGRLAVVLRTVWDRDEDAEEFVTAWSEASAGTPLIERRGREVVVIEGLVGEDREAVKRRAWRGEWRAKTLVRRRLGRF